MSDIREMLGEIESRQIRDRDRWANLDGDACQVCDAHGEDKRSLYVSCFYDVHEVVPEAIWLKGVPQSESGVSQGRSFFYLRICKSCRARFLGKLREWREDCIALRGKPKDHDGYPLEAEDDAERNIPIRVDGAIKMLTRAEWDAMQAEKAGSA